MIDACLLGPKLHQVCLEKRRRVQNRAWMCMYCFPNLNDPVCSGED